MAVIFDITEKPKLNNPILIEGLPGIGYVAGIASLHLITELKAKRFAQMVSSSFHDFAVTTQNGNVTSPINELYYVKREDGNRDLIIWYGNTQAMSITGQYELCGKTLKFAQELGCNYVISIGGFKRDEALSVPNIYSTATDLDTMATVLDLGTKVMVGNVFGIAGISIGLAKLYNMKGFSLLVDTPSMNPDVNAARYALMTLFKFLNFTVDLTNLEQTGNEIKRSLELIGLLKSISEEKKKEEQQLRWFI
ncbi:MAG: PAC2 family protein [Candidatus Bathyarchaeota archaeon]|nr:PAC2 family protein [Candidatus Termiticorpusculum sp.]